MSESDSSGVEANSLTISVVNGRSQYNRNSHPPGIRAAELLAHRYGEDKRCVLLPSGMAAITFSLTGVLLDWRRSPIHVVMGNELYTDTPRALKYLKTRFRDFELHIVDIADGQCLIDLFRQLKRKAVVLLAETCTNPGGDVMDFSIVPDLRRRCRKFYFLADNTWITSSGFNPFDHQADLVVVSTSKYYSAGKCIGGAVIGEGKLLRRIAEHARIMGQHISPIHAQYIIESLRDIDKRVSTTADLTLHVARWLEGQEKIRTVKYVGLPEHRSCDRARAFFKQGPCVLSFLIGARKETAQEWMARNAGTVPYETSFGGPHSKFDPWPKSDEESNGTWCRLAIGYDEEFEDITSRLTQVLDDLRL